MLNQMNNDQFTTPLNLYEQYNIRCYKMLYCLHMKKDKKNDRFVILFRLLLPI
jgi:hypothetical protein